MDTTRALKECNRGGREGAEQAMPCWDGLWSSNEGPRTSGGGHTDATWAVKVSQSEVCRKGVPSRGSGNFDMCSSWRECRQKRVGVMGSTRRVGEGGGREAPM